MQDGLEEADFVDSGFNKHLHIKSASYIKEIQQRIPKSNNIV